MTLETEKIHIVCWTTYVGSFKHNYTESPKQLLRTRKTYISTEISLILEIDKVLYIIGGLCGCVHGDGVNVVNTSILLLVRVGGLMMLPRSRLRWRRHNLISLLVRGDLLSSRPGGHNTTAFGLFGRRWP